MTTPFQVAQAKFAAANDIVEKLEGRAQQIRAAVYAESIARSHGHPPDPTAILAAIATPIELHLASLLADDAKTAAEGNGLDVVEAEATFERVSRNLLSIRSPLPQDLDRRVGQAAIDCLALIEAALKVYLPLRDKCIRELVEAELANTGPKVDADGPVPPNTLRWQGMRIDDVQPKPCQLLAYLWPIERCSVKEVELAVWGDEGETDNRLKTAIKKANEALARGGCPRRIKKQGNLIFVKSE